MKEKTKDKLKSWCITLGFAFAIGLCAFGTSCDQNVFKTSAYSVNQQEESVTFSKEELNNVSYSYLSQKYITDEPDLSNSYIISWGDRYEYSETTQYQIKWYNEENETYTQFVISGENIGYWLNDGGLGEFEENLIIYSNWFADNMQNSVTLTASQLNENTFEYFANTLNELSNNNQLQNSYIIYDNKVCKLVAFEQYSNLSYELEEDINIQIFLDNTSEYFAHWYINDNIEGELLSFTNSITIYSTYIHDNLFSPDQYQDNFGNALTQFVQIITSGLVDFATGVAQGIMSMATGLFLNNGSLSVFGGIVAIFAGLALAVGITTRVYTWVTSLGN